MYKSSNASFDKGEFPKKMSATLHTRGSKRQPMYSPIHHYVSYNDPNVEAMQQDAYARGRSDGAKDMQIELIKRGKALFQLALQKASEITSLLVNSANENNITVYDFHLKIEDWDNVTSLIIVKLEDYIDDKIDAFYRTANEISAQFNDDTFHWNYLITYYSDTLNQDKILTDGFNHLYEHTPRPRPAQ